MAERRNPALLKPFCHRLACNLILKRPEWWKCQLKDLNLVSAKFKESFVTMGIIVKYFSIRVSEITSATMSSSFIPSLELMSFCRLKQWPGGTQPGAEPMLLAFCVKAHHHFSNSSCRSSCITESNWCSAWSRKAWSCKKAWVHAGYCQEDYLHAPDLGKIRWRITAVISISA